MNSENYKAILIIEDDADFCDILSSSFAKRGYLVKTAKNFSEAEKILKIFHPNHALVDLKLNMESGINCIELIHNFDKNIKIIMLTGYASISSTIEAIKKGACYYLAKPVDVETIISAFNEDSQSKKSDENFLEKKISNKKTSLKNFEFEFIHKTLLQVNYNITKAAKMLGMHRRTLARKIEKKIIR
jgi:two-component system response regulator RegA